MKYYVSKICLLFIGFSIISCSSTNGLTMGVTLPAQIDLPSTVDHIGIINRSLASENNKVMDKIDKILSLEGLNLDKDGAQNQISGLKNELERGNRFESVTILENGNNVRRGLGVFPAALPWGDVERICKDNDVDVLFSLEFFDTDTAVDYQMAMVAIPNSLGIVAKVPGHRIELNTLIKNGWRVYDPVQRIIIDEYTTHNEVFSIGEGINPVRAYEAIVGRKEAVLNVSSKLGVDYASSTRPERIRISRDYFVRGNNNFKRAKRLAQVGDWDGAAELWAAELSNSKGKVAGRAYYNMAISNEINGNLDKAIEYASLSYTDFNNTHARRYVQTLRNRIIDKQVLENQLTKLNFSE